MEAAISENTETVEQFAANHEFGRGVTNPASRVEAIIQEARERVEAGSLRYCAHLQRGPAPAWVALAFPDTAYCDDCWGREALPRIDASGVCDVCGRPSTEFAQTFTPIGPFTFFGALCTECRDETRGDSPR